MGAIASDHKEGEAYFCEQIGLLSDSGADKITAEALRNNMFLGAGESRSALM